MKKSLFLVLMSTSVLSSAAEPANPTFFQPYMKQAEKLVQQMTEEQKVGQMLMPTFDLLTRDKGDGVMDACKLAWKTEKDAQKLGETCGLDGIKKYHLGAVLSAGGPLAYSGDDQARASWKKAADLSQSFYDGPAGTSLLLGTDAIHGDQHIPGSILFPQNIGLGATHNPQLVSKVAYWTAQDVLTSSFNWSFMPTVSIVHDYRWGRTYESFGADSSVVKALSEAYIEGLQDIKGQKINGIVGTAKHFIGDGATEKGQDEGYAVEKDLNKFWQDNGAGYEGAAQANVGSMMLSYNSLNDVPMHFGGDGDLVNKFRNTGVVGSNAQTYRMGGFVVSDYVGVSRAAYKYNLLHKEKLTYVQAVAKAVNAGVDMLMLGNGPYADPFDYDLSEAPYKMRSELYYNDVKTVQAAVLSAVNQGLISKARLDEAATRILAVKLAMAGNTKSDALTVMQKKQQEQVALQAAEESLVLLKNDQRTLPLKKDSIQHVFLMGEYDDIGVQNGGWSINWQGQKGNQYWPENSDIKKSAAASSLKDGVLATLGTGAKYHYGEDAVSEKTLEGVNGDNAIAVIVIAEPPYAEYMGDVDNDNPWYKRGILGEENAYMPKEQSKFLGLTFSDAQTKAMAALKKQGVKVVTVLYSGRPVIITEGAAKAPLTNSDAFIAAFLPGTTGGQAIANAMFGKYKFKSHKRDIAGKTYFSNTLPFAWPASMQEVREHRYSLFPLGFGLES